MASARIFYSQRLGIYQEAFPSLKSIAIINFFIILVQGPFVVSFMYSFPSPYTTLFFVFANWFVSGFVISMYRFIVRRNIDLAQNESTESEKPKLYLFSCLTSWVAPFTVLSNQPADRSKYLLTVGLPTVVFYSILNGVSLYIRIKNLLIEVDQFMNVIFYITIALTIIISPMSLIMLNYLGNYHNMYKLSKCCCCCSPIIHKSMIYDYLVNPELIGLKPEEDFPLFFKSFLKNNQMNVSFPQTGDTVLHIAFLHARFR